MSSVLNYETKHSLDTHKNTVLRAEMRNLRHDILLFRLSGQPEALHKRLTTENTLLRNENLKLKRKRGSLLKENGSLHRQKLAIEKKIKMHHLTMLEENRTLKQDSDWLCNELQRQKREVGSCKKRLNNARTKHRAEKEQSEKYFIKSETEVQ